METLTIAKIDEGAESVPQEGQRGLVSYAMPRIIAFLIDFKLILAGPFYVLLKLGDDDTVARLAPVAHWIGLGWVYLYFMLIISLGGRSIGMLITQLKLVKTDGSTPGTFRLLARWTLLFLIAATWKTGPGSHILVTLPLFVGVINLSMLVGKKSSSQLLHDVLDSSTKCNKVFVALFLEDFVGCLVA